MTFTRYEHERMLLALTAEICVTIWRSKFISSRHDNLNSRTKSSEREAKISVIYARFIRWNINSNFFCTIFFNLRMQRPLKLFGIKIE